MGMHIVSSLHFSNRPLLSLPHPAMHTCSGCASLLESQELPFAATPREKSEYGIPEFQPDAREVKTV